MGLGIINGICAGILCELHNVGSYSGLWIGVVAGGLWFACRTDLRYSLVYDYTWWMSAAAGACLLYPSLPRYPTLLWQLVIFFLLQRGLFGRFYGRADVYAFCVCALVEASWGMGLKWYLLHMSAAFVLLAAVQGRRHNIGRDGNLKTPVPFLPYITVSFWGILLVYVVWKPISIQP
ncbi:MAG: hypothetical protein NC417_09660 [Candidatus Gastranaerophilales bacterium]|nr:hypothetical protein [Candidatus Gastranaerophilales bacterium]